MTGVAAPTLRAGLWTMLALAVPTLVIAGVARGGAGFLGAALGVGLVSTFFAAGKVALVAIGRRIGTTALLPVALGVYAVKVVTLGVVLVALEGTTAVNLPSFAWSIVAGTLCWVGAEVWSAARLRVPFYEPGIPATVPSAEAEPDVPQGPAAGPAPVEGR
ncbi:MULTISPECIES: hypothetical protein [unclassified Frankia]